MKEAFPTVVLPLARYAARLKRQKADVMVFKADGLELRRNNEVLQWLPREELRTLIYTHFPKGLPGMVQMFSGGILAGRADDGPWRVARACPARRRDAPALGRSSRLCRRVARRAPLR